MTLTDREYMYKGYDFETPYNNIDVNNKLFCTFVTEPSIDSTVEHLSSMYNIMYNKMFVLHIKSTVNTLLHIM
jgi:hypothetical protein